MVNALSKLEGELSGTYYALHGMDEETRQQLVDDHFLFKKGDRYVVCACFEICYVGISSFSRRAMGVPFDRARIRASLGHFFAPVPASNFFALTM